MSPLRRNEALKFTLLAVERKQVWNQATGAFEIQDILPVSISADHRIFDANTPVPQHTCQFYEVMFDRMLNGDTTGATAPGALSPEEEKQWIQRLELLIEKNVTVAFKVLLLLQTYWFDFLPLEEVMQSETVKNIESRFSATANA